MLVALSIFSFLALIGSGFALWLLRKQYTKSKLLHEGAESSNLEDVLGAMAIKIKKLETELTHATQRIAAAEQHSRTVIAKVGLEKYNALAGEGGNLSFSLALLNEDKSGILISSINGRNHNRVYAKNIVMGESAIPLTSEEETALKKTY